MAGRNRDKFFAGTDTPDQIQRCLTCEIAECTGLCHGSNGRPPKTIPAGFSDSVRAGLDGAQLSRRYGVARSTVYKWKRLLGLTEPKKAAPRAGTSQSGTEKTSTRIVPKEKEIVK